MEFNPSTLEIVATVLFAVAVLHTFSVKRFEHIAHKFPEGSIGENTFHFLAEVEVVFGVWAGIFIGVMWFFNGAHGPDGITPEPLMGAIDYLHRVGNPTNPHSQSVFTEPCFVFVIMAMAATRPVIQMATRMISGAAKLLPMADSVSFFLMALIIGPILGSFITEPAAMTVTALILRERYYDAGMSKKLMYGTIGVLFVNVSVGGTLTNFAAPPVLMVAAPDKFDWDTMHMITHFGWKSAVGVIINALALTLLFKSELTALADKIQGADQGGAESVPLWLTAIHIGFLTLVVLNAHYIAVFMGIFLFFLGMVAATHEYQDRLKLRESLLVGFFLAGLVTLGGMQRWWLGPILGEMGDLTLFLGATGLTAITDNAALTYLGSLVKLTESSEYALVAGAVAGGGLTVIANAPNPAGFGILKGSFGDEGISPLGLLIAALAPTAVVCVCLWFLPHL